MAFVNEKIPEDKQQKYCPRGLTSTWAIDHERDAILVYTDAGGMGEAYFFDLYWEGGLVEFITTEKLSQNKQDTTKNDVEFTIDRFRVLGNLHKSDEEIKNLIREALQARGFAGSHKLTGKVVVNFSDEPTLSFNKKRRGCTS